MLLERDRQTLHRYGAGSVTSQPTSLKSRVVGADATFVGIGAAVRDRTWRPPRHRWRPVLEPGVFFVVASGTASRSPIIARRWEPHNLRSDVDNAAQGSGPAPRRLGAGRPSARVSAPELLARSSEPSSRQRVGRFCRPGRGGRSLAFWFEAVGHACRVRPAACPIRGEPERVAHRGCAAVVTAQPRGWHAYCHRRLGAEALSRREKGEARRGIPVRAKIS
jgi:hypothetical protein